jgi:hypothetical protein
MPGDQHEAQLRRRAHHQQLQLAQRDLGWSLDVSRQRLLQIPNNQKKPKGMVAPASPPAPGFHLGTTPRVHRPSRDLRQPVLGRTRYPLPHRRHRLFYQHLLLAIRDRPNTVRSIRNFDPLPDAMREQANWARLLSDPEWGSPVLSGEGPRKIPFIDITDEY